MDLVLSASGHPPGQPLADLSEIDEAVRRFNETAANLPVGAFAPGGNFWARQAAGLAANRQAATNEANDWINQQVGQRMPGGMAPGPEAGRLGLSADPRYGAQFPGRPPAPQLDPALAQRANEAAQQVGYDQFRDVKGRAIPLEEIGGVLPEISDTVSPVLQDQIRQRNIQNWMASNPEYNAWKEAAQAAFADAHAKGLPAPRIDGPTFVGDPRRLPSKEAMDAYRDARKQRTQERRDRIMAQMERNRAAAAIRNLRDPQTRNAVLAAGLFGGQMPQNAAIALQLMGHPDAAKLFADNQRTQQELAFRAQEGDKNRKNQREIAEIGAKPDPARWAATYTQVRNSVLEEVKAEMPNATPEERERAIQQRMQQRGIMPPAAAGGQAAPTAGGGGQGGATPAPASAPAGGLAARLRGATPEETAGKFTYDAAGLKNVREITSLSPDEMVATLGELFPTPHEAAIALFDPDYQQGAWDAGIGKWIGDMWGTDFSRQRDERKLAAANYLIALSGGSPQKDLNAAMKSLNRLSADGKIPQEMIPYWEDFYQIGSWGA